jgi:hypothetical protein
MRTRSVLRYEDWVYSVAARGGLLLVAAGPEVLVHDLPSGKLLRKVRCVCWLLRRSAARWLRHTAGAVRTGAAAAVLCAPHHEHSTTHATQHATLHATHARAQFQNLHEGPVSCLEGTHSGRLLFTGGSDGLLLAHDLRMKEPSRCVCCACVCG